ncbi:MAG: hypothetical protein ATN31_01565 [Candidatus Epulonipiscioides saccharophilum]|nr:MAG: hypothetical protein ATN31_01565 [Epulopiscium sp. AS2M-Bin001]
MYTLANLILMGGKNKRMNGFNKGLINTTGQTFLEIIYQELSQVSDTYVSVNRSLYKDEGLEKSYNLIEDKIEDIGPMGGIYSGLKEIDSNFLFVTACDMPFVSARMVEILAEHIVSLDSCVAFCDNKRVYPMAAIYPKNMLSKIEEHIKEKNYKLLNLLVNRAILVDIALTDLSADSLANINTLSDLERSKLGRNLFIG